LKTCATGAPLPNCGGFSITGGNLGNPALALETEWFNGLNVPDPGGNINGFGFYQPMFESPADVVFNGPVSPINLLPVFDKLFVGMTTGGTSNVAQTFSKNFPSLWDFRPGDDAFDTTEPYLDPYTGLVTGTVPCGTNVTVQVLSKSGNTITVSDPTGLGTGMFLTGTQSTIVSIVGNVVTLSAAFSGTTFPTSATFSRIQPIVGTTATLITPGSAVITVSSAANLAIGQILNSSSITGSTPAGNVSTKAFTTAANTAFPVSSTTNVGLAEGVIGGQTGSIATTTTTGSFTITVPNTSQVAVTETVTGTGIAAGTVVNAIAVNPDATLQITLNNAETANGATSVKFDSTPCFAGGTLVVPPSPQNIAVVTVNNAPTCTSFVGVNPITTQPISNGIPVTFIFNLAAGAGSGPVFPAGTSIVNIVGTTITLSSPANAPLPGQAAAQTTTNVPLNFLTLGSAAQTTCPMIPFSSRGGASTDPNDGSLWLFGEFAKNRLSTIPGPGQWGTSVANYPLSFPAVDPYNNDNTFFQDVQPGNIYFTWIQIAKNLGIAVPSALGPCTINNGGTPIQQPPAPGTTPISSPSQLTCPLFNPSATITRAEMAYWVVKAQMDEAQVSAYLCATGGDPSGTPCPGGIPGGITSSSFADVVGVVTNPFLAGTVTTNQLIRYIEVMYRRGYTKGCQSTDDPLRKFCPNDLLTRGQMSVFLIRAKMNNVFPTTLSGTPLSSPYGDNFGLFQQNTPYFSDVTTGATDPFKDYYIFIQKMRELRITNGTGGSTFSPGNNITRQEIATFIVRAFFL